MAQNKDVNELFKNTLIESEIKHFFVGGVDKYVVYDDTDTLFVVRINNNSKKYFLCRTKLMMKKYAKSKLAFDAMPDCEFLCNMTVRRYKIQERLDNKLKRIFNMLDSFYDGFCKKTK